MKQKTRPVIVDALEWRKLEKDGKNAGLQKSATIVRAKDGAISFIASSAAVDRYGDTIDQNGWELANFKANPVLLWAHSHNTPPVGKVGNIGLGADGNLTAADVTFTPKELNAFGAEVEGMVRAGFLSAVSVGFLPLEWEVRYSDSGEFLGYHFKRMELLELSVVPVPAHPLALVTGKSYAKTLAQWLAAEPDDAAPATRAMATELTAFLKAAEDLQTAAGDNEDQAGFGEMIALLKRIAVATEENGKVMKALLGVQQVKATGLSLMGDDVLQLLSAAAPVAAEPAKVKDAVDNSVGGVLSALSNP